MYLFIILIALFLAMNVGANNTAAEMGAAYTIGSRSRKEALTLIAVFVILGAIITGLPVLKTLGGGTNALVHARAFKAHFYVMFVVMAVTALYDFISSAFKVSIPTSYVVVASIAGAGFYYEAISESVSISIVQWWVFSPLAAFAAAFVIGKVLHIGLARSLDRIKVKGAVKAFLAAALTFSGCYVAFAGGANGAAKAMAPIVAAGVIDNRWGILLGGMGIAAGALIFGKAALKSSDKEMTEIGFIRAILIEVICASVLIAASFNGIPVSVSATVTAALTGLGCAELGFLASFKKHHITRTIFIWFIVPVSSMAITYFVLNIFNIVLR